MGFKLRQMAGGYSPRTELNCKSAMVTIAMAIDYTTAGERLTKKSAGIRYYAVPYHLAKSKKALDDMVNAMPQSEALFGHQPLTIHFAGNGIYTFAKQGITQKMVDKRAYTLLSYLHSRKPIAKLWSGGQSGADEAGVKAALRLGIDVVVTMPANNRVRFEDGVDVSQTDIECIRRLVS
jgi:hypothetical protein